MLRHGFIAPHTDSDLVATNDRYGGRWQTSSDGLAPSSWSDAGMSVLIYLTVAVACFGAALLLSELNLWPGVR